MGSICIMQNVRGISLSDGQTFQFRGGTRAQFLNLNLQSLFLELSTIRSASTLGRRFNYVLPIGNP